MKNNGNWVPIGSRIMDKAYMRDGKIVHMGETLVLAVLLHAKGRTNRGLAEVHQVASMMDDPNINKRKTRRK